MKTIATVLVLICATSLLAPGQAVSEGNVSAASKVRALELDWSKAEARKDNAALDALFDSSLVFVDYDGALLTKSDYLARVRSAGPGLLNITTESMTVRVVGNAALVVGIYRETGIKAGKPYEQRRRFIDTWALKQGRWVCIAAAATALP